MNPSTTCHSQEIELQTLKKLKCSRLRKNNNFEKLSKGSLGIQSNYIIVKFPWYRKKITKVIAFFPILWCGGKLATLQCHVTQKIWNLPKSYIDICSFTIYKYIHHNLYTKYVLCTLIVNMIFLFSKTDSYTPCTYKLVGQNIKEGLPWKIGISCFQSKCIIHTSCTNYDECIYMLWNYIY